MKNLVLQDLTPKHKQINNVNGVRGKLYELDGEMVTVKEVCEEQGLNATSIRNHICKGKTLAEAIKAHKQNAPVGGSRKVKTPWRKLPL